MRRRLYYCDHHEMGLPPGHKFPARKYRLLRELLEQENSFEFVAAEPAPLDAITRVHDRGYVESFVNGSIPYAAMRRIGFPWSESLVRRTLGSVGGTLAAAMDALESGWGGNLAGGTHHACRSDGAGFCVFNDIAVAVLSMRECRAIRRVAILDLDVHQGDGTARIFENDDMVLTVSVHNRNNFPFRKQPGKIDVDLPDGTGDREYLDAVDKVLARVLEFKPEMLYYQSGVDPLAEDRLGRMSLTQAGLARRDRRVFAASKTAGIPVAVTLGGGYAEPIELTAEAHANTFRCALDVFG